MMGWKLAETYTNKKRIFLQCFFYRIKYIYEGGIARFVDVKLGQRWLKTENLRKQWWKRMILTWSSSEQLEEFSVSQTTYYVECIAYLENRNIPIKPYIYFINDRVCGLE